MTSQVEILFKKNQFQYYIRLGNDILGLMLNNYYNYWEHVWVVQGKGKAAGEASEHCIGSSSVLVVKGLGAYADQSQLLWMWCSCNMVRFLVSQKKKKRLVEICCYSFCLLKMDLHLVVASNLEGPNSQLDLKLVVQEFKLAQNQVRLNIVYY